MHSDRDLRDQLLNALGVSPDSALRAGPAGKASASTADHTGAAQPGPDRQDAGRTYEVCDTLDKVGRTLSSRHDVYGDIETLMNLSQGIQFAMSLGKNWHGLPPAQREALQMIASKIARILNGDPNYRDNWHDIQGYARLAEERCRDR